MKNQPKSPKVVDKAPAALTRGEVVSKEPVPERQARVRRAAAATPKHGKGGTA